MKRISHNDLRNAFARQAPPRDGFLRSPDAFWADFRARARMCAQDQPATAAARLPAAWPVFARACAAVAVIAVAVWFVMPAGRREPGAIRALEVVAPHSAVLIIKDAQTDSTVVWLTGMHADT